MGVNDKQELFPAFCCLGCHYEGRYCLPLAWVLIEGTDKYLQFSKFKLKQRSACRLEKDCWEYFGVRFHLETKTNQEFCSGLWESVC